MRRDKNTEEQPPEARSFEQIRRDRNKVLGLSLAAFVILVFFISIAKLS